MTGVWHVRGLAEGTATLTETTSGASWTAVADGTWRRAEVAIEYPRIGETYSFEVDVDSPLALECTISRATGEYDPGWRSPEEVSPTLRCGLSVDGLEIADPGLADCLEALPAWSRNTASVYWLDCSNRDIEDLSGLEPFIDLDALDVSHNRLTSLDSLAAPALESLDVSHNALTHLDGGVLTGEGYGAIVASHNEITGFTGIAGFGWNRIDLSNNRLERFEIPRPADAEPSDIRLGVDTLDLSHNELTEVDLTGVRVDELDVSWNDLDRLDARNLGYGFRRLNAAHNRLSATAPYGDPSNTAFKLPLHGVHTLDISHNAFSGYVFWYVGQESVEFTATNNAITRFDFRFASQLERADLSRNAITTLLYGDAPSLKWLDLSWNRLQDFDWRERFDALRELDLTGNAIDSLAACDLPDLWRLHVGDNHLVGLDLSGCESLEDVDAAGNRLTSIDFSWNPVVAWADLRANEITCQSIIDAEAMRPDAEILHDPEVCAP